MLSALSFFIRFGFGIDHCPYLIAFYVLEYTRARATTYSNIIRMTIWFVDRFLFRNVIEGDDWNEFLTNKIQSLLTHADAVDCVCVRFVFLRACIQYHAFLIFVGADKKSIE